MMTTDLSPQRATGVSTVNGSIAGADARSEAAGGSGTSGHPAGGAALADNSHGVAALGLAGGFLPGLRIARDGLLQPPVSEPLVERARRLLRGSIIPAVAPSIGDGLAVGLAARVCGVTGAVGSLWVLATVLALAACGMRPHARILPRAVDDLPRLLSVAGASVVLLVALAGAGHLGVAALAVPPAIVIGRALSYASLRGVRQSVGERTLILGAGAIAVETARALLDNPTFGLLPIGFLDDCPGETELPLPIVGGYGDTARAVRHHRARRLIVAFGPTRDAEVVDAIRDCDDLDVEIHVVPRLFELGVAPRGPLIDDLYGLRLVRLPRLALRSPSWRVKRIVDTLVASLALVLLSPLLLAIALAVRLSSPGPILFEQQRLDGCGRSFKLLKFRTMRVNSDADVTWSVVGDPRVTTLGAILRRTGLDELPQLINVLRGEMSMVGPRPERPFFAGQFADAVPRYQARHRVPGGLTGLAQVNGLRGDTSIVDRVRFDNAYVEHWSLWLDLSIALQTLTLAVRRRPN